MPSVTSLRTHSLSVSAFKRAHALHSSTRARPFARSPVSLFFGLVSAVLTSTYRYLGAHGQ
eukprot:3032231-Rhodomonas_salina.1